jgi:uncharacterized membrane protein HdeD (DUF308 family)
MANVAASRDGVARNAERLSGKWASIVAFGALLVILGVTALIFARTATTVTITLNGVFFLIAGVAEIVIGARSRQWRRFFLWLAGGALYLAVGGLCIANPGLAFHSLTLSLGACLIAAGVVRLYVAARLPPVRLRPVVFLAAAATFLLGLIIVSRWPSDSVYVIGMLLGVDLLLQGASWVSFGVGLQPRS